MFHVLQVLLQLSSHEAILKLRNTKHKTVWELYRSHASHNVRRNHVEEMAELLNCSIILKLTLPDCENAKANTYSVRPKMIVRDPNLGEIKVR